MVYIREHPCPEPEGFFDIVDEIRLPSGHIIADMDFFTNTQQRKFTWHEAMELNEKVFKPEGWHLPTCKEWVEICLPYMNEDGTHDRNRFVKELKLTEDKDIFGGYGRYWSSSANSESNARILLFCIATVNPCFSDDKDNRTMVRLVKDIEE